MADYRTAYVYAGGSMSGLTLAESKSGWRADFARLLKKRKDAGRTYRREPSDVK